MNDSIGRREGRHASSGTKDPDFSRFHCFIRLSRDGFHVLTTDDGNVNFDIRPDEKLGISECKVDGGWICFAQIYETDNGGYRHA